MTARRQRDDDDAVGFDQLHKHLDETQFFTEYADLIHGYNMSRNGLLLWRALAHCRQHGQPVPENLLELLAQYAEKLLAAAQKPSADAKDFAAALHLKAGTKGLTAWRRADAWRQKSQALALMNTLVRNRHFAWSVPKAAKAVAKQFGLSAGTLQKDYSRWLQKPPRGASDWRSPNYYAFTAHLAARPKGRKVLPKKAAAR